MYSDLNIFRFTNERRSEEAIVKHLIMRNLGRDQADTLTGSVAFLSHSISVWFMNGAKMSLHFEWYVFNHSISSRVNWSRSISFT